MRKITTEFGENAGKIWKILSEGGKQPKNILKDKVNLDAKHFHTGIGWLARENKIRKDNEYFQLDQTNLTDEIGSTAGKVYKILDIWEQADIDTLLKLSDKREHELFTALGWLAREDKITLDENNKYMLK